MEPRARSNPGHPGQRRHGGAQAAGRADPAAHGRRPSLRRRRQRRPWGPRHRSARRLWINRSDRLALQALEGSAGDRARRRQAARRRRRLAGLGGSSFDHADRVRPGFGLVRGDGPAGRSWRPERTCALRRSALLRDVGGPGCSAERARPRPAPNAAAKCRTFQPSKETACLPLCPQQMLAARGTGVGA